MYKAALKVVLLSLSFLSFISLSSQTVWANSFFSWFFKRHPNSVSQSIETAISLELIEMDDSDERTRIKKSPEELRQILDHTKEVHKGNHVTTFLVWIDSEKRYLAYDDFKRHLITPRLEHFRKGKIYSVVITAFPDEIYPFIESEWMLSLWSGLGAIPQTEYSVYHTIAAHPNLTPKNMTLEEFYSRMSRLYEKGLTSSKTERYVLRDLDSCISIFQELSEKSDKRLANEINWFATASHTPHGHHTLQKLRMKRDEARRKIVSNSF